MFYRFYQDCHGISLPTFFKGGNARPLDFSILFPQGRKAAPQATRSSFTDRLLLHALPASKLPSLPAFHRIIFSAAGYCQSLFHL